ncbi:MAG: hypothetical protein FJ317_09480 [SAR202 cluster bacterium]|nr:hypothetical protein [SAR202 cluster bacterium]
MFFRSKRRPYMKVAGVVYPALTLMAIVATGNHYFVDAIAGAIVVLASYAVHEIARHGPFHHPLGLLRHR